MALDFGGVTRDVFCSFWDQLINNSKVNLFSGQNSKVPIFNVSNSSVVMTKLPIVGCILSHSYLVTGCFPTSLSLAGVIFLFLGSTTEIDEDLLLDCFFDYLPQPESEIIKKSLSLSKFDDSILNRLIDIYSVKWSSLYTNTGHIAS